MHPLLTSTNSMILQEKKINSEIKYLTKTIDSLPEGTATVNSGGHRKRMTGSVNGEKRFFSRDELPLVQSLIYKKYLTKRRDELIGAQKLMNHYIRFTKTDLGKAEKYLMDNPARAELIKDFLTKDDRSFKVWMSAPDPCAAPHQEKRTEETLFGLKVRSKSEVMIATYLYENGIPFRYEEPLVLGGVVYCPDFTFRDPKSGAFYWYEHFGKMDEPDYVRDNIPRLITYADHGIVPGINLVLTYETKKHKLSLPQIRAEIQTVL